MTDKKLLGLVTEFRDGLLGGDSSVDKCFMVCMPLHAYLNTIGIPCRLIEGDGRLKWTNHFWLELMDGRIIDPTADQFTKPTGERLPKVFFDEMPDWYPDIVPIGGVPVRFENHSVNGTENVSTRRKDF